MFRFCFHHFHSDDDVQSLAELIGNLQADARRGTPDGSSFGVHRMLTRSGSLTARAAMPSEESIDMISVT
jgi:hypothetical protein